MPSPSSLALVLGLLGGEAEAVRLPPAPGALCALAESVVVVIVTGATSHPAPGPLGPGSFGGIETHLDLHVERRVHGADPGEDLVVVVPGGSMGGLRYETSESAQLEADGRYLLFVGRDAADRAIIVGGADGALRLRDRPGAPGLRTDQALALRGGCRAP